MKNKVLLLRVLTAPSSALQFSLVDWDTIVRQARAANLLASLHAILSDANLLESVPVQPMQHLIWSAQIAKRQTKAVEWEVMQLQKAFAADGLPLVLLKGAAYVIAKLAVAKGRLFSDIDLIVPKEKVDVAEAALMLHGWESTHHDEYDQRYYRTWMHELPPMQHVRRLSVVDLHHAILPETAALHPDSKKLLANIVAIQGKENIFHFSAVDMILHSATHLFHDGELEHGLRDLLDIHVLLNSFCQSDDCWDELSARASELGLGRPLYYALRYASRILKTVIPDRTMTAIAASGPNSLLRAIMDLLFDRALLPDHPSCVDLLTPWARRVLYIRANWLRMPPMLLARHLFHKAFISPQSGSVE